jgi:hypothetical protein
MEISTSATCFRKLVGIGILMTSVAGIANAQEVCGLQAAKFGTALFRDGFEILVPKDAGVAEASTKGAGLGPPMSTVLPPALGVAPTITIVSPETGATLPHGRVQVVGTVTGPTGTGVIVNGVAAHVHNGVFATPSSRWRPGSSIWSRSRPRSTD